MKKNFTQIFTVRYKLLLLLIILLHTLYATATTNVSTKLKKIENSSANVAVTQTITFNAITNKTYTNADFDPGATASSNLPVTYMSSNTAVATIVSGKVHIVSAGTVTITASQPGDANYSPAPAVQRTFTINKSSLIITANSLSRIYGDNNPTLTVTYSGFKTGENETNLTRKPTITTTATITSNVGFYAINVSGPTSNNYNFILNGGILAVTKAPLNVIAANKTKIYGAANPALTTTYVGFKNGESNTVLLTQPVLSTAVNVNSTPGNYAISILGATANNYDITHTNGTFTVAKANLTVTAQNKTKVYNAALPQLTFTISGFVLAQNQSILTSPVNISTTADQNSVAGVYPIILSGAAADNYNIIYRPGTLTITKLALRIIADSKFKVYGDDNPELTVSYIGFVNGDNASVLTTQPTVSTVAQTNSPAGTYNITVNGATSANYTITNVIGRLTIGKAALRIAADNMTKTYGDVNPVLTITYTGFTNGDTEADLTKMPVIATTATTTSKVGNYPITVKGATSTNYTITYANAALSITKANLTIKANDVTRVYGTTAPAFTVSYTGFVNGEGANNLSKRPTLTAPVNIQSPVGTYVITPAGATSINYNITYETGTLTIEKRTLNIIAANKTKAYGAAVPALTVVYAGLVNKDKAIDILTGTPELTTTATPASTLGTYPVKVSGNVTADNYDINFIDGTLTVNKALIKVSAPNMRKVYGQANPVFTLNYTGFVNGDNISVLTTLPEAPTTTATTSSDVGTYAITTTGGATADNYNFQYIAGTIRITKATLNVVIDNKTKVYGEPNPEFTYTLTGFLNGDTEATSVTTKPVLTASGNAAGTFAISSTDGLATNYNFRSVNGALTVSKANLLIAAEDKMRGYGMADPAFTAVYTGFVNGDTQANLTALPVFATTATPTSGLGTYPITVSGATSPNYNIAYTPATLTINKARLIVKAVDQSRNYGAANPVFTVTYDGFVNGDTEANLTTPATATTNVTATTNAGAYNIVPSGVTDDRYEPEYTNGTLTINKANVTVTAQNATRIYGTANPVFEAIYSGFANGETQSVLTTQATGTTPATQASGVGNYEINFVGAVADNYTFAYVPANLSITPASLAITANNASRVYGATDPAFSVTYSGFVNGDTQASLLTQPVFATSATVVSGIGNYPITVSGATANNYTVSFNPGTLTITKAPLLAKADDKIKAYGEANPAFTVTYTGFVNGETSAVLTTQSTASVAAGIDASTVAGTYPITAAGGSAGNYNISYSPGTLTIGKILLTVTANSASKSYGAVNPALNLTYTGFVGTDNAASLTIQPTATTTATTNSPAGNYNILVAGGVSNKYTFAYNNGTLSITKKVLLITADDKTKSYGTANPAFTSSYTGFVNGDTEASLINAPVYSTAATTSSAAGTYTITPSGAVSNNYDITYANGSLTINKAQLIVRADDKAKNYGDANPAFTITYTGFVNGETQSVLTTLSTASVATGVNAATSPGSYTITATGGSAPNYNINYATGTLTIGKAQLRVTANPAIRNVGEANPAFTLSYNGFVNGEDENSLTTKPTATTTANTASPAGNYTIVPGGGASANYAFNYTNGILTVGTAGKPALLITARPATRVYGAANPAFEVTYTGFVNGDTEASMTAVPVFATTATTTSGVGQYTITPSGAVNNNYTITYATGVLTVSKATLIAKADDKAKAYGQANPAFTVAYTGFVNGETPAVLTAQATASAPVNTNTAPGTYSITATGGSATNYNITYATGTLTVGKALLTVNAANASRAYGAANPALSIIYTGFVGTDNAASLTTQPTVSTTATAASPAGDYAIIPAGGTSNNYTFAYNNGTLSIGKATLTAIADNKVKNYGDANPAFTITYTGFVNGETSAVLTSQATAAVAAGVNASTVPGTYTITPAGGSAANYNLAYTAGTLTIAKATLTVTANNASKAYGAANPALSLTYTGFIGTDNAAGLTAQPTASTIATTASLIGTYVIAVSGGVSNNYNFAYNNGTLTVGRAQLTVTAADKTKIYGSANPVFTVTYSGFVNGDTESVLTSQSTASVAGTVTAASGAGTYAITPAGGAAANYSLVYTPGTLTITKAPLTITANNATRTFGAVNPVFTFAYNGFLNGDTQASLTALPSGSTTATATSAVGNYPIVPGGAVSANYTFSYVNGVLSIAPGTATISFGVIPLKTFGDADFDPAATNTAGEPMIYTSSNPAVATIVNNRVHIVGAGITTITASFAPTSGYALTVPATKSIEIYRAPQTITFNAVPVITRGGTYSLSNVTASSGLPVSITIADPQVVSLQGSTLTALQIGNTTLTATQAGNANYLPATFIIQPVVVSNVPGQVEVQVHQAVSPNGDGINDVFFIEGIANHPNNQVTLINRNGIKVYEVKGYDNVNRVFDGRSNVTGSLLQPGTYFYLIQYMVNGQGRRLTGYFVLKY